MAKEDLELFHKLGFEEDNSIKPINQKLFFNEKRRLSNTAVYFYEAKNSPEYSFYFFSSNDFKEDELKIIHSRVWNENKVKLYFTKTKTEVRGYPAFTTPNNRKEICNFSLSQDEKRLIEAIHKTKIESGFFWFNFLKQISIQQKNTSVNKELIDTLKRLKENLEKEFAKQSILDSEEIIQALIDRTLFVKFLEDKHIINSDFYSCYFNQDIEYKSLLQKHETRNLNKLFGIMNKMFGTVLFNTPNIAEGYLTNEVLDCLYHAIAATGENGQLSLFDFEFDIMPVEFIGHIYQVFQKDKKKKEGIVYTPENLANMLVEKVIGKFVVNSSNFYNENSQKFRNYFFSNYKIEEYFDLSKIFKTVYINYDSIKTIEQDNIKATSLSEQVEERILRIISKLENGEHFNKLIDYLSKLNGQPFHKQGLALMRSENVKKEFFIKDKDWKSFTNEIKEEYKQKFLNKYLKKTKDVKNNIPYIKPKDIGSFVIKKDSNSGYLSEKDRNFFHRHRDEKLRSCTEYILE